MWIVSSCVYIVHGVWVLHGNFGIIFGVIKAWNFRCWLVCHQFNCCRDELCNQTKEEREVMIRIIAQSYKLKFINKRKKTFYLYIEIVLLIS